MKKNLHLGILSGVIVLLSSAAVAQWTKTVLPAPPYGHGALPGRVNALAADGSSIYAGTLGGNLYYSVDNGGTWVLVDSGMTNSDITAIVTVSGSVYVGAYGNLANISYGGYGHGSGIYITSDNGTHWRRAGATLADTNIFAMTLIDSEIVAGTWGGGAYISSDQGATWSQIVRGLDNPFVRTLAVGGIRLFAGTWGDGVFFSDDHGQSWTQSNLGINNLFVNSIVTDGPSVYMGNTEGVYKSGDGGFSWTLKDSGLTTSYINTFVVIHPNLILGTSGDGVFVSANNGESWMKVDTGLTDGYIYCFAVNGSKIFAGSLNGEVWSRPLAEIITAVNDRWKGDVANSFKLYQNYPNPFNPATKIVYQLAAPARVTLRVFDMLGKVVATLVDGIKPPGTHEVMFDASHLSSGVYVYQIRIGDYTSSKKMVLMK